MWQPTPSNAYRSPSGENYDEHKVFRNGETIGLEAFPDIPFAVDDLIGNPAEET